MTQTGGTQPQGASQTLQQILSQLQPLRPRRSSPTLARPQPINNQQQPAPSISSHSSPTRHSPAPHAPAPGPTHHEPLPPSPLHHHPPNTERPTSPTQLSSLPQSSQRPNVSAPQHTGRKVAMLQFAIPPRSMPSSPSAVPPTLQASVHVQSPSRNVPAALPQPFAPTAGGRPGRRYLPPAGPTIESKAHMHEGAHGVQDGGQLLPGSFPRDTPGLWRESHARMGSEARYYLMRLEQQQQQEQQRQEQQQKLWQQQQAQQQEQQRQQQRKLEQQQEQQQQQQQAAIETVAASSPPSPLSAFTAGIDVLLPMPVLIPLPAGCPPPFPSHQPQSQQHHANSRVVTSSAGGPLAVASGTGLAGGPGTGMSGGLEQVAGKQLVHMLLQEELSLRPHSPLLPPAPALPTYPEPHPTHTRVHPQPPPFDSLRYGTAAAQTEALRQGTEVPSHAPSHVPWQPVPTVPAASVQYQPARVQDMPVEGNQSSYRGSIDAAAPLSPPKPRLLDFSQPPPPEHPAPPHPQAAAGQAESSQPTPGQPAWHNHSALLHSQSQAPHHSMLPEQQGPQGTGIPMGVVRQPPSQTAVTTAWVPGAQEHHQSMSLPGGPTASTSSAGPWQGVLQGTVPARGPGDSHPPIPHASQPATGLTHPHLILHQSLPIIASGAHQQDDAVQLHSHTSDLQQSAVPIDPGQRAWQEVSTQSAIHAGDGLPPSTKTGSPESPTKGLVLHGAGGQRRSASTQRGQGSRHGPRTLPGQPSCGGAGQQYAEDSASSEDTQVEEAFAGEGVLLRYMLSKAVQARGRRVQRAVWRTWRQWARQHALDRMLMASVRCLHNEKTARRVLQEWSAWAAARRSGQATSSRRTSTTHPAAHPPSHAARAPTPDARAPHVPSTPHSEYSQDEVSLNQRPIDDRGYSADSGELAVDDTAASGAVQGGTDQAKGRPSQGGTDQVKGMPPMHHPQQVVRVPTSHSTSTAPGLGSSMRSKVASHDAGKDGLNVRDARALDTGREASDSGSEAGDNGWPAGEGQAPGRAFPPHVPAVAASQSNSHFTELHQMLQNMESLLAHASMGDGELRSRSRTSSGGGRGGDRGSSGGVGAEHRRSTGDSSGGGVSRRDGAMEGGVAQSVHAALHAQSGDVYADASHHAPVHGGPGEALHAIPPTWSQPPTVQAHVAALLHAPGTGTDGSYARVQAVAAASMQAPGGPAVGPMQLSAVQQRVVQLEQQVAQVVQARNAMYIHAADTARASTSKATRRRSKPTTAVAAAPASRLPPRVPAAGAARPAGAGRSNGGGSGGGGGAGPVQSPALGSGGGAGVPHDLSLDDELRLHHELQALEVALLQLKGQQQGQQQRQQQ